jgi:hypothetical protein
VVMAVCAMAAGTLRDGASMPPGVQQRIPNPAGLARKCYQAAVKAIPRDLTRDADPCQVMKAKALMISICLQSGDTRVALAHMGDYATLSAINGFHLEGNWPNHITEIEKQERRRLVHLPVAVTLMNGADGLSTGASTKWTSTYQAPLDLSRAIAKLRQPCCTHPKSWTTKTSPREMSDCQGAMS